MAIKRFDLHSSLWAFCDELRVDGMLLKDIHGVIVGGESGPGTLPMKKEWVESIQPQCQKADVAFFFKLGKGVPKHVHERDLNGQTCDEVPTVTA